MPTPVGCQHRLRNRFWWVLGNWVLCVDAGLFLGQKPRFESGPLGRAGGGRRGGRVGRKLTVIAWLWARTVKSPNPAFSHVDVPLASTFMLATKPGKEAYVEPVIEGGGYRFTVKVGKRKDAEAARLGTTAGKRSAFLCLMSGVPVTFEHIRHEGQAGHMGARLMAIVADGEHGRIPPADAGNGRLAQGQTGVEA